MSNHNSLEELRRKIAEVTTVSFDIFDTLVVRCIANPKDLFPILGRELGVVDVEKFSTARITAESDARQAAKQRSNTEEITLTDIYNTLKSNNAWSSIDADNAMDKERSLEVSFCTQHKNLSEIYNYAVNLGKRVILTSDMYLDEDCINLILRSCGYTSHKKLYLSSSLMKTKHHGSLFDFILQEENLAPNQLLHIGDNKHSDFDVPRKKGIKAHRVERGDDLFHTTVHDERLSQNFSGSNASIERALSMHYCLTHKNDFWGQLGYTYMGPMLEAFVQWLVSKFQANDMQKVMFLARDGFILNKAFELLKKYNYHQFDHSYVYASRRSLLFPAIKKMDEPTLKFLCSGKSLSVADHLTRIGIDPQANLAKIHAAGFNDMRHRVNSDAELQMLRILYVSLESEILHEAELERSSFVKYLEYLKLSDFKKIALVDVGWHGTLQEAISQHLTDWDWHGELNGYYFGTFAPTAQKIQNGLRIESFTCHCGEPENLLRTVKASVEFFEWFFSAPHGSVIRFKQNNTGKIMPVLEENSFETYRIETSHKAQLAALEYIEDKLRIGKPWGLRNKTPEEGLSMISSLLHEPTFEEACQLGNVPHVEGFGESREVNYLAKPSGKLFNPIYLMNLRRDYGKSHWKTGFKRRLFGLAAKYI
jgi:predicted HAD superfamily hydrolase